MRTLKEAKIGENVRVVKLHGEGAIKRRIMDMGLTKGVEVYIRKVAPLGDPVEVTVRGEDKEEYSYLGRICYDCVRESITNTLKYGNASKMDIVLRFFKGQLIILTKCFRKRSRLIGKQYAGLFIYRICFFEGLKASERDVLRSEVYIRTKIFRTIFFRCFVDACCHAKSPCFFTVPCKSIPYLLTDENVLIIIM